MENYMEVAHYGRGAGTDKPYIVAFELSVRKNQVSEGIRALNPKSGLAVKRINGGGKPVSGYINLSELNVMKGRVKYAQEKILEASTNPATAAEAEYIFKMGKSKAGIPFSGKTATQLLLEGVPKEDLLAQRDYLNRNATGKFAEANKKGVAAIDAAVAKLDAGTLSAADVKTSSITLFKSGPRYFALKKPQPYETTGWELNILCTPTDKNPFSIEWQTKTVTINENVIASAKDVKTETAALTETEFLDMWETLMTLLDAIPKMDIVERLSYNDAHKDDYKSNGNYQAKPAPTASVTKQTPSTAPSSNFEDDEVPFK